jgi:adenylate cyclase
MFLGYALMHAGRPQDAIPVLKQGLRVNPLNPFWKLHQLSRSYIRIREYEEAISYGKKALHEKPSQMGPRFVLAAAYAALERDREARAVVEEILNLKPMFSLKRYEKGRIARHTNPKDVALMVNLLRKAGLPD